jgi:hypothetical protein
MTNLLTNFNERWALAQGPAVGDLPPAVSTTREARSLLLLSPQDLSQGAAMRLFCVNMQIQRFIAHWQLAGDQHRQFLQVVRRKRRHGRAEDVVHERA